MVLRSAPTLVISLARALTGAVSPSSSTGESTAAHCKALSRTACMAALRAMTGAPSVTVVSVRRISAQARCPRARSLRAVHQLFHA